MNNKGKVNVGIIIVLIILSLSMIASGVVLMLRGSNDSNNKDNFNTENNQENNDSWKMYHEVKQYELDSLQVLNLNEIEVNLGKISFESNNNVGTLDFSNSSYIPGYFSKEGFEGYVYMSVTNSSMVEKYLKSSSMMDASIFTDTLRENQEVVFYNADKSEAYANCIVKTGDSYWNIGVNIESKTIDEAVKVFKQLIPLAVEYDSSAPTIEEFSSSLVKQVKVNIENITFDNVNVTGTAFTYKDVSGAVKLSGFGSHFYNSYFYLKNDDISLSLNSLTSFNADDTTEVKELKIKSMSARIYRKKIEMMNGDYQFIYNVGFIQGEKEYIFDIYITGSQSEHDEQKIIDFLNKIIN